ncbi:CHAT domain-containing protein [Azospirillum sp. HJ39]|uniref:CHAT domain-containing protein n=1 Tax=Azospirillum sp. HJ39 TaxID=3159496 RepID=UPI003557939F
MVQLRIRLTDDILLCLDGTTVTRKPLGFGGLDRMKGWTTAFDAAVRTRQPDRLSAIGQDIATLLNAGDGWLDERLTGTGPVSLEIQADDDRNEGAQTLFAVPWELLASSGRFLAANPHRLFLVARRLGRSEPTDAPEHGDLAVLFMAAEVEGQHVLDYEREEVAFLDATRGLNAHLAIEESGSAAGLALRLKQTRRWEALHLTGHGDLGASGPYLALETEEGACDPVDAGRLCALLGDEERMPRLVFLSACRTAERPGSGAACFVQALVGAGVANAVGWDGSVQDGDAIRFAETFYGELAGGRPVVHAAALARCALLTAQESRRTQPDGSAADGAHWHLARVWLGPRGGGSLCEPGKPTRPARRNGADKAYLDKAKGRVPVATAEQFVGRRRAIQQALRAWSAGSPGVLIQGMGNLGKSSLAERIASRVDGHTVVVVFERYDAHAVFHALVAALPEDDQAAIVTAHEATIVDNPAALKLVLQKLLKGPFSGHGGSRPILLIIDDLERILADPKPGERATPFKTPAAGAVMGAVIASFRDAGRDSASRLLITSRYEFALTDARGDDLAGRLSVVALPPMDVAQRTKQMRTAARLNGRLRAPGVDPALDRLEERIRAAAGGNPGLQEVLTRPLLTVRDRAAGMTAATRAVAAVESYLASGQRPAEDSAAQEFFQRVSLEAFRAMLTPTETIQLRAATLFPLAVPVTALEAAGRAAGIAEPGPAVERLQGLGLLDRFRGPSGRPDGAVNPLARPLVSPLSPADQAMLAVAVVGDLYAAWAKDDGQLPANLQAATLANLALLAEGPPGIVQAAVLSGGRFLFNTAHEVEQALDLVTRAVSLLDRDGTLPIPPLLRLGAECAGRLGRGEEQDSFLARATSATDIDPQLAAMILYDRAVRLIQIGQPEEAETLLCEASERFQSLGDVRARAVTMGKIADILTTRGQTDEALRIRREEELPVHERLGDVRERAVTMGKIADILTTRGQTDEALRIRREEQIPVYERLGDVRSRAVTMGKIADILTTRGQTDEALRLWREEVLPAFERLGDVRSRAVAMGKIADILTTRGQTDEALRIRREEELPVHERLGDVRERAVTMGKIADILTTRGQTDEALRIRREEQIPVYERLGDVRSRAVTMGKIADILTTRGQTDEALRIRREEELPVYERLGDVRSRAVTMGKIADILTTRGQTDEALRIRREEELPVYERLGDVRSRAVTMGKIADILTTRGQTDEALRIRREEELPVYERLGDVRSRAVTMGKIADILTTSGESDKALRIRREEELPVYERLGDVRERAVTMGKIADILTTRGQTDEALRIRREEELPVHERLGDVRERAVTMGKIADILTTRGQTDEALRIRREEQIPVYERLGDVRSRAVTMGKIADILTTRGQTDEALRIRREEELPVYERLGDVRSRAVTMGKIADILTTRGQTDEALRIRREEELPVYERLGDVRSRAVTMGKIADILTTRGESDKALRIRREEQLPVYERLGDVRERAVTMGKIADILTTRGQTDEALRIRREEQLPVHERLGDVRSRAVTMGKIADILTTRGQTDEALRIHLIERLPVAQQMQDLDSLAHIRFSCATIRLQRGGLQNGEAVTIAEELAESFGLFQRIGRVEGVGVVGALFGQILAAAGQTEAALSVLDQAADAFTTLGHSQGVGQVRSIQDFIRKAVK